MTRTALEVEQPRQILVALAWSHDLAREDAQLPLVGSIVVDRDAEFMVGQQHAGHASRRDPHVPTLPR